VTVEDRVKKNQRTSIFCDVAAEAGWLAAAQC